MMVATRPLYELEAAYREQRPPRFVYTDIGGWSFAIYRLLVSGQLEVAEHAARHAHSDDGDQSFRSIGTTRSN
jgi:hypothetical protein